MWKRHIDHLHQMEDTPRELLKSNDKSPMEENEFANSETDDDFIDNATDVHSDETTETASEPIVDARHYPQRTHHPPDRLIHQDLMVRVL